MVRSRLKCTFADAGAAWNQAETVARGGSRAAVTSAGVALRANCLALPWPDFTRAFDRPGRGWVFGFNLMPGW